MHKDYRSHTGGTLSLGKGAIYNTSSKQKLNTKSSTEAELVGVDDLMPQIIWTRYFLMAQGYEVNDNILYQDNQSAIKLEKNGRQSMGKRSRHINIRYFFVTDRIGAKEVTVKYCPTEMMLADYYTKPLQGKMFRIFRDMILNIESGQINTTKNSVFKSEKVINKKLRETKSALKKSTTSQECVEENVKENVNGKMYVNINEKLNKMKDIISKDIKETSAANRTYRDVCANDKGETSKKRVRINTKPFMMQEI